MRFFSYLVVACCCIVSVSRYTIWVSVSHFNHYSVKDEEERFLPLSQLAWQFYMFPRSLYFAIPSSIIVPSRNRIISKERWISQVTNTNCCKNASVYKTKELFCCCILLSEEINVNVDLRNRIWVALACVQKNIICSTSHLVLRFFHATARKRTSEKEYMKFIVEKYDPKPIEFRSHRVRGWIFIRFLCHFLLSLHRPRLLQTKSLFHFLFIWFLFLESGFICSAILFCAITLSLALFLYPPPRLHAWSRQTFMQLLPRIQKRMRKMKLKE